MKRAIIFIMLTAIIAVSGCAAVSAEASAEVQKGGSINFVSLSDSEDYLVSAVSDIYYRFKFTLPQADTWLSVWVDEYRFGEKTARVMETCGQIDKTGTIIFALPYIDADYPITSILQVDSGGTLCRQYATLSQDIKGFHTRGGGLNVKRDIPASADTYLACLRYSNKTAVMFLSDEFYADYKGNIGEIADQDITYILGCSFYNEQPEFTKTP